MSREAGKEADSEGEGAVGPETADVLDILKHEPSQQILVAASRTPMSAQELADDCDISLPTVYRRVNELAEKEFLETQMQPRDDGNHHRIFETNVERVRIVIENGVLHTNVKFHGDIVDRFGNFWQDLELDLSE
jgi:DNA-binding MarR family transcriptional regulator